MYLDCTCASITIETWNNLMKYKRKVSYKLLCKKIKEQLPELYNSLSLNLRTYYEDNTYKTKTHYILTHSGIEYFIKYNNK